MGVTAHFKPLCNIITIRLNMDISMAGQTHFGDIMTADTVLIT